MSVLVSKHDGAYDAHSVGNSAAGQSPRPAETSWTWQYSELPNETSTFVVNVACRSPQDDTSSNPLGEIAPCQALSFLFECLGQHRGLVKLLFSTHSGYVAQSDFLSRRMVDCLNVGGVRGFLTPGQRIEGHNAQDYKSMPASEILTYCYGAVYIPEKEHISSSDQSKEVDEEMVNRLSFPWLASDPVVRKRLGLVGGGSLIKSEGYLIAAASLNVALVVFDEPQHWLATASQYREEFVPLDMTIDAALPERITAGVSHYQSTSKEKLDGLMTADEHLLSILARTAESLGFPTSPAKSVSMAQNKFQTRQLDSNVYCRLVKSQSEFEALLAEDGPRLRALYPLIVKPSKGWSSEGVWKVANEEELRRKVPMLWQDGFTAWHGNDVVVEQFIEGPEVDANLVLVDGQTIFFETSDDFPSTGDLVASSQQQDTKVVKRSSPVANFVETSNQFPSALPPNELRILQQRLHELALAAGFQNAVLHIEARLHNSSFHYAKKTSPGTDSDDFVDLEPRTSSGPSMTLKDVFLIEINPRAPGFQECEATAHVYGISYYSLSVLRACFDMQRMKALSQPFLRGAQYHLGMELIAAEKGGVYRYGDVCNDVLQHAPHLREHVVKYASLMEDGQEVPDPSTGMVYGNFIAYFLVASRTSRAEAITVGQELRSLIRKHTNGF